MHTSDGQKVATPADWRPGEKMIVPPGSYGQADKMVDLAPLQRYAAGKLWGRNQLLAFLLEIE
ncbi:MAG: hypothetical protein ACOX38_08350 [Bacillota bacterium]